MGKDISKEWLKVNKLCKEIRWLSYDPDYKDFKLEEALKILTKLKDKLGKDLDGSRK